MEKVKVHLSDGSVQTIEGDVTKVIVKDIPTENEIEFKLVDVNEESNTYETYTDGGPHIRPRTPR